MFQIYEKEQYPNENFIRVFLYIELWKNYFYGLFFLNKKHLQSK